MKDYLFKEQSAYPSVLLSHTKPEGGFPTKHEDTVIVPIIKHSGYLGRAVCHTQQYMPSHSANQITRNKCFVTLNNAACKFLV